MAALNLVLLVASVVVLFLAAIKTGSERVALVPLGLVFFVLTFLVAAIAAWSRHPLTP
jgi:pilus assembly protein TadC